MVGQENKTPDADTGFVNQYRNTTCSGLLKQPDKHEATNGEKMTKVTTRIIRKKRGTRKGRARARMTLRTTGTTSARGTLVKTETRKLAGKQFGWLSKCAIRPMRLLCPGHERITAVAGSDSF